MRVEHKRMSTPIPLDCAGGGRENKEKKGLFLFIFIVIANTFFCMLALSLLYEKKVMRR